MEMAYFERERDSDPENLKRRIYVNLQGQSRPFSKFEAVNDLARFYAQGITNLDRNPIWLRVLDKIDEAIRQDNAIPVYKSILTSTIDRLQAIPLDRRTNFSPTYGETLERIGIKRGRRRLEARTRQVLRCRALGMEAVWRSEAD